MTRLPVVPIFPSAHFLTSEQLALFMALTDAEKSGFVQRFYQMVGVGFHHLRDDEQPLLRFPDKAIHHLIDNRDHGLSDEDKAIALDALTSDDLVGSDVVEQGIYLWRVLGFPLAACISYAQYLSTQTESKAAGNIGRKIVAMGISKTTWAELGFCGGDYQVLRKTVPLCDYRTRRLNEKEDLALYQLWFRRGKFCSLNEVMALVELTGYSFNLVWPLVSDWGGAHKIKCKS